MKKRKIKKSRAIIYDIKDGKSYFLVLHRVLHWSGWEILKETIKENESPGQAIERGIKEETQLENFEVVKDLNKQEKWEDEENEYFIVVTYLVKADMNEKISLKQEIIEHDKYEWLNKEAAIEKLTWLETKELVKNLDENLLI